VEDATTLEEIICFRRVALRQAPPPKEGEKPDKAALAQAGGGRRWWSRIRAASQRVTGRGGGGAGEAWSETDLQVKKICLSPCSPRGRMFLKADSKTP